MLRKATPFFQTVKASNIDRTQGVIKSVVIINSGEDKVGDNIDDVFLSQVIESGNSQSQGVKSRFGHPNLCDDALGSYIGRYKDFRLSDDGSSVVADLYLDRIAQNSPKGDLYSYVMDMATKANDMFGNSIVFSTQDPEVKAEMDDDGNAISKEFIRLKNLVASDLVDSPAATNSLFKSDDDFASKATTFLDENPEILNRLSSNPDLVTNFLNKYLKHSAMKPQKTQPKSLGDEIKAQLANLTSIVQKAITSGKKEVTEQKTIDLVLADGTTATVQTDAAEPAVGDAVIINGSPAEDGDHVTDDGRTITTADGVITGITPAQTAEPAMSDTEVAEIKAENESLKAEMAEIKSQLAVFTQQLSKLKSAGKPAKREQRFTTEERTGTFTKEDLKSAFKPRKSFDDRLSEINKAKEQA